MSIDELLSRALALVPDLKWGEEGMSCKYCGARGSKEWHDSRLGAKSLCHPCHELSSLLMLDQGAHQINPDVCSEKNYLIDLILEGCPVLKAKLRSNTQSAPVKYAESNHSNGSRFSDWDVDIDGVEDQDEDDDIYEAGDAVRGVGSFSLRRIDCYEERADCKECGENFEDVKSYRAHVREHFSSEPDREWMKCATHKPDGTKYKHSFLPHLTAKHGYTKPFVCLRCVFRCSTKTQMHIHLRDVHNVTE